MVFSQSISIICNYMKKNNCSFTDMQTTPLKSVPYQKVIVNGVKCSEYNVKNNEKFSDFFFSSYHRKLG